MLDFWFACPSMFDYAEWLMSQHGSHYHSSGIFMLASKEPQTERSHILVKLFFVCYDHQFG